MRLTAFLFIILILSASAEASEFSLDSQQEARAAAIGAEVRCVVCQSESVNDSQADMARNMRLLIRDKIHDGWDDQQIYDYLRGRYGDFILLRPPFQKNTWILWLCPIIFIFGAGGWVMKSLLRKQDTLKRQS